MNAKPKKDIRTIMEANMKETFNGILDAVETPRALPKVPGLAQDADRISVPSFDRP